MTEEWKWYTGENIYLGQKNSVKEEQGFNKLQEIPRKQITNDKNESDHINNYFAWEQSQ